MASAQSAWGIDLGRSALKAIKLRVGTDDAVEIVAFDFIEHDKVLTQPDADRNKLISSALEKFLSRNDISKDSVVVSVPGQQTLARFTKLPPVAPKRIPDIVRYEADQQIPFDMDEVIWDYQTFQQEGMPDLEVGIFAMKRELIREHLLHFEQASIEPIAVQPSPLAVYNAVHFDGLLGDETTILLDIGAENTDLIIATKASFWTRTVPIGGNKFTEALVKSFKLSFSKAENLKRTAASSKYARQIFQSMRPVFADLVQELQRSIGFYSSTHRDTQVEKVVCVGAACRLAGLQKYLQQNLGLTVERPDAFKRAAPAPGVDASRLKERLSALGVAYGLAVQGLDLAQVASNLLPTEIAKQLAWRRKRPAFAIAAACFLLAGGLFWFLQLADHRVLAAGMEASAPSPSNEEAAAKLIEREPGPNVSGWIQAKGVKNAGNKLQSTLKTFSGKGETERSQAEALIAFQRSKTLVPSILEAIHESIPIPEGPLGRARTQEEVLAAIEKTGTPRDGRRQMFIDRLEMQFEPNVNEIEWETMCPVPDPINDPDANLPAFKIAITCRTPYKQGAELVCEDFMKALRRNGRRAGRGFYFDRVYLFEGGRVDLPEASGASRAESTSSSGFGGRGRGSVSTTTAPVASKIPPELLDPVTNEPIENDWKFVVWVDAIPEEVPEDAAVGADEEPDDG